MERNVIVTVFNVESEGFQALAELKREPAGDTYQISAAALVKNEGGNISVLDGFDTGADTLNDTAVGGLVGMTAGILGGPIGMLLGASYGSLIGMSIDVSEADFGSSMLEKVAGKLEDGMQGLILLADEETPVALDNKLSAYEGVIARFDADAVAEEVDRAREMEKEITRLTKMELRKEKKAKAKASASEKFENLKSKFKKEEA